MFLIRTQKLSNKIVDKIIVVRKIVYWVTNKELTVAKKEYFNKIFKNSVLFEKNEKFYFHSKINNFDEEISVSTKVIEFNEELATTL